MVGNASLTSSSLSGLKNIELDGTLNSNKIKTSNLSIGNDPVFSTGEEINILSGAVINTDEINKLIGVKENIQRQLDDKASAFTGAATSIAYDDLESGRVVVSDNSGKVSVAEVTADQLNALSGINGNIQDQLDSKGVILEGGTGVTISENTEINIGQDVGTEANVTFEKVSSVM